MMPRALTIVFALLIACGPVLAAEREKPVSRHTFRSNLIDAGSSDRLARPVDRGSEVRVVRALPLRGEERSTSSASAATSNLTATAPLRVSARVGEIAKVKPAVARLTEPSIVRRAPLVVTAAEEDVQPQFDDRAAVDNNARLAPDWRNYAPATVSYEQAQQALGAHRVQEVGYGNTYGTYSPEEYYGRFTYASYPSRTYYYPSGYYGHRTYAYNSYCAPTYGYRYYAPTYCRPVYYRPTYCAPTYYYRPSYSYCAPRYYGGYYGSYYYRPSYSFGYGYSRSCGSSWGFSIGW